MAQPHLQPPDPPGPSALAPKAAPGGASLPRDLTDFLIDFSIVLHKRTMYPPAHPHSRESVGRFGRRLEALLERQGVLMLGVARHQLIVGGIATDPRNALISDLARRLHRQRVASLRIEIGTTTEEVEGLLDALSLDPAGPEGPLGLDPARSAGWRHLQVQPPEFGRLMLAQEENGSGEHADGDPNPPELWVGLANLALSADGESPVGAEDPLVVARAIDEQVGQASYDRIVLDYLGGLTAEVAAKPGVAEPRARERVSRLIANLHPDTLRSLLRAGGDDAERRRFARTVADSLAVEAVVEVVEAAAATTGQTISDHLLRLLHKFATQASQTDGPAGADAEAVLRANVARLLADWELEDPNPTGYTAVLDGLVRQAPLERADEAESTAGEAESVLQIALETGSLGARVYAALERLNSERRFARVAELLADAPSQETADALWRRLATPARLREELGAAPVDWTVVEELAVRLGAMAANPLLDVLESAQDQSTRSRVLRVLARLGAAVEEPAAARLPGSPWFMQRNILVLFRNAGCWPATLPPETYTRHPDVRVRVEAYRLFLERPEHRARTIRDGMDDVDDGIARLALQAALEFCPADAAAGAERVLSAGRRSPETLALALRLAARDRDLMPLRRLLPFAAHRRLLLGWRTTPRSPLMLAAMSALATYWSEDPVAAAVLARARRHADAEVRHAAGEAPA